MTSRSSPTATAATTTPVDDPKDPSTSSVVCCHTIDGETILGFVFDDEIGGADIELNTGRDGNFSSNFIRPAQ